MAKKNKTNQSTIIVIALIAGIVIAFSQGWLGGAVTNVVNNAGDTITQGATDTPADAPPAAAAPAAADPEECVDSDDGQDIFVEGQIDGFFYLANGDKFDYTYYDDCEIGSDRLLIEMSCEAGLPKVNSIDCADNLRLCDNGACVFPASIDEACQMKYGDIWSPISSIAGFASDKATCDSLIPDIVQRAEWTAVYEFGEVCCHIGDA